MRREQQRGGAGVSRDSLAALGMAAPDRIQVAKYMIDNTMLWREDVRSLPPRPARLDFPPRRTHAGSAARGPAETASSASRG